MHSLSEQVVSLATVLEAIVLLPILLEFISERRKRQHSIDLSLEIENVGGINAELAGLGDLLEDIRDLVDRARHPEAYKELALGNEILIAGPPLAGKKTLARRIAKEAQFERIITVHNPRNADALARAKQIAHQARNKKIMLLLPRLDLVDERENQEVVSELDALIEAISEQSHALVIGTTNRLAPGSEIDNLFGVTLTLPGAPILSIPQPPLLADVHRMLADVCEYYLDRTLKAGYELTGISRDGFIARILMSVTNPAQIEDIVVLCQTSAIYRQRSGNIKSRQITSEILEIGIRRVVTAEDLSRRA